MQKTVIKQIRTTIAVSIVVAIFVLATGCGASDNDNRIVDLDKVERISIELFDHSEKVFDGGDVGKVVDVIKKAKLTKYESVQDAPDKAPLGRIAINEDEEILYYYYEDEKSYIEKPYEGIYELTENIDKLFSEL
ncbi:DUF5301 domain-containing protein [Eubacterium oxidoreducens]|uniref:DUF5301 domain-containing protein n=1 Tax=Eubacterium oxidoreducens TaxID=1732 RepID=A0A1G6A6D8_EUBOX|nr:DUF5301 domain-containing protein [Eubacterium oxidoreducens]SDB04031.1 hypothetical protein SAMN02910417_00318 [Eubacterium oxidoreducens]